MNKLLFGGLAFAFMLFMNMMGMPTFVSMFIVGVFGAAIMVGWSSALALTQLIPEAQVASFSWVVIPLFVFMGVILVETGIGANIFTALRNWIGHVPGGVAASCSFTGALIGTMTGSMYAATGLLSRVAYPEMRKFGYQPDMSFAVVATSGPLSTIIPPSVSMVIAAILANESVGSCLLGGLVPGFIVCGLYMIVIFIRCRLNPGLGPPTPAASWRTRIISLRYLLPMVIIMVTIIGGLLFGIFTATEAAGCGAVVSICVALAMRKLNLRALKASMLESLRLTLLVMLAIMCARGYYIKFLTISGITYALANACLEAGSPMTVMLLMFSLQFISGMFIGGPMNYVIIPLFAPVVAMLGFDLTWFVVMCIMMTITGTVSPPICMCVFLAQAVIQEVPMNRCYLSVLPFLVCNIAVIALIVAVPNVVLFLPNLARGM